MAELIQKLDIPVRQVLIEARIVEAADAARRRLERDLHDGAQQRLVALAVKLGLARRLVDADPEHVHSRRALFYRTRQIASSSSAKRASHEFSRASSMPP